LKELPGSAIVLPKAKKEKKKKIFSYLLEMDEVKILKKKKKNETESPIKKSMTCSTTD
jgi:hypothetical protein